MRTRLATDDEYLSMLMRQGGCCAICGSEDASGRALAVDHDHDTGKVRGLLCTKCNVGLGYFSDDPARLRRAASYLSDPAFDPEMPVDAWSGSLAELLELDDRLTAIETRVGRAPGRVM